MLTEEQLAYYNSPEAKRNMDAWLAENAWKDQPNLFWRVLMWVFVLVFIPLYILASL